MGGVIGLDTNVRVRYLEQDDPKPSRIAAQSLESMFTGDEPGFISLVVLAERLSGSSFRIIPSTVTGLPKYGSLCYRPNNCGWSLLSLSREPNGDTRNP
jgi:hypothetical protein